MSNKKKTNSSQEKDRTSSAAKVLIADDHQLVRFGIRTLLESEPNLEVCGEADDDSSAMRLLREESPDPAVVDISLDGSNGLKLTKRMIARRPVIRVVVLSMHDEQLFAERALRAGALGYVSKHAPARQKLGLSTTAELSRQAFLWLMEHT